MQSAGKICILDIDVQGVQNVKKSTLLPYYVFIAPPSMEQLEARLRGRGTESELQIQTRLANSAEEIAYGTKDGNFDFVLINDNLEESFQRLLVIIQGWYPNLSAVDATAVATNPADTDPIINTEVANTFQDIQLKDDKVSYRPIVFCGPSGAGKGKLLCQVQVASGLNFRKIFGQRHVIYT